MKPVLVIVMGLLLFSMPFATARLELLVLPDDVRVNSLYLPTLRQNVGWGVVKRYSTEDLINILRSSQAGVNVEKYADGRWVSMNKQEFVQLLQSGKVKDVTGRTLTYGTSKNSRKPDVAAEGIGRCKAIYNPINKNSISLRQWNMLSKDKQQELLSHPYTKKYLAKCF